MTTEGCEGGKAGDAAARGWGRRGRRPGTPRHAAGDATAAGDAAGGAAARSRCPGSTDPEEAETLELHSNFFLPFSGWEALRCAAISKVRASELGEPPSEPSRCLGYFLEPVSLL